MSIVRVQGCCIEVLIQGQGGVIECVIQRILYYGRPAYEVDFWQGMAFMAATITAFRAGVIMEWEDDMYRIVSPKRYRGCNQFWLNLELTMSNHISINS